MALYFESLLVWQKAFLLAEKIHHLVKKFPKEEQFALTDQMRRSSLSIVSNIAEGSARGTNNEYAHFLYIARGSCVELYAQILLADKFHYLSSEKESLEICQMAEEIIKMLSSLAKIKQT